MNIAVLIPTIHRPEGLTRTLESLKGFPVLPVVALEPDDIKGRDITEAYNARYGICDKSWAGCAYGWNTALMAYRNADIYVIGADDAIFDVNWMEEAMKGFEILGGSGLVGFESGKRRDFSDHYMMTRDFIIEHHGGVAAIPHYTSWCVDDEAILRAKRVNKFFRSLTAIVRHEKGTEDDEGYHIGQERRKANKELFYRRKEAGFPDDFEAII